MTAQPQTGFQLGYEGRNLVQTQYAALCYRLNKGKPQILLITSRGTKRWIIPKGWPMSDRPPGGAALQEAYEEAGVIGRVTDAPLGMYSYIKTLSQGRALPCVGVVYAVHVDAMKGHFPEEGERRLKWFSRKKAARKVGEPELARIIRDFDPGQVSF